MADLAFWQDWWSDHRTAFVTSAIKIAVIALAYVVLRRLVFHLLRRVVRLTVRNGVGNMREARIRALHTVLLSAAGFVLAFVAVIMMLQAAGLNIVPLLTTASVAGLAIGFGAQKLVKDVISGFFILVEDQYGVGDYVTIGPATGTVEDLGMRTTRIRDSAGKLFMIANGDINQVFNHSRGPLWAWMDVCVPSSSDLGRVKEILTAIGIAAAEEMTDKIRTPFKPDGLAQIGGDKVSVRFTGGVVASTQDEVLLALNERIRTEFEANGMKLA